MGKTVVATIAAASILLGGVVSASAAEPAPTGGETNGEAEFPSEAVSSTTSSDQPDLFYWGEKISYGDETAVFFDPRFWPTDALMNKDTVENSSKNPVRHRTSRRSSITPHLVCRRLQQGRLSSSPSLLCWGSPVPTRCGRMAFHSYRSCLQSSCHSCNPVALEWVA